MRYGSICSGIEASSVAWDALGWKPEFFSDIDPFAVAVTAHRWPSVLNIGDFTTADFSRWEGNLDVLFGSPPCQSYSIAGKRGSLEDERGNLAIKFAEIAHDIRPKAVVFENVPHILNAAGNPFGQIVGKLVGASSPIALPGRWPRSGVVAGPKRDVAWRVLDSRGFGVPTRRQRLFLVSLDSGDGTGAAEILLEPEGGKGRHGEGSEERVPARACGTDAFQNHVHEVIYSTKLHNTKSNQAGKLYEGYAPGLQRNSPPPVVLGRDLARRMTPAECERLMGFPTGHTDVTTATGAATDTKRYAALGNSIAVPILAWIGERLDAFLSGERTP